MIKKVKKPTKETLNIAGNLIKWRKINFYNCVGCQKKRSTFFYKKAKEGICRKCRKAEVNENQTALF